MRLPAGFVAVPRGRASMLADSEHVDELRALGLDDPARWEELLAGERSGLGRGRTGTLELAGGRRVFLKKMLRGGLAGPLWRNRFPGTSRLVANLRLPLDVASRGVPTPAPVALLIVSGPPLFYRAWIAFDVVDGARDLAACLRVRDGALDPVPAAMRLVRDMHEQGLEHRDLNLGNILITARDGALPEAIVIDLDRARLHAGPLSTPLRLRSLRRLERSYEKLIGPFAERRAWYAHYAAGEPELLAGLLTSQRGQV